MQALCHIFHRVHTIAPLAVAVNDAPYIAGLLSRLAWLLFEVSAVALAFRVRRAQ